MHLTISAHALVVPNQLHTEANAIEACRYILKEKLPVLYNWVPEYHKNGDVKQQCHNTNPVESWNEAMINKCDMNHNSSAFTLIKKLVNYFMKQVMYVELAIHGLEKYTLATHIPVLLCDRLLKSLTSTPQVRVENFCHWSKAVSFVLFAYSKKLDTLCSILKVEADTYEVAARQILIDVNNVYLVEHDDKLPVVMVYDAVTESTKPSWWTVRTNDYDWTSIQCSCSMYTSQKLWFHVVLACQKVNIDTYLIRYEKWSKPSSTQIIQIKQ